MKYPYETHFGTGWIVFDADEFTETVLPGGEPPATPTSYNPRPQVETLARSLTRYFDGDPGALETNPALAEQGSTPFLVRVYRVVAAIPSGQTMTYGEVAGAAGNPKAARAVGQAMAKNRFAPIIPCHRVVPASGGVGSYGGGSELKKAMLDMEAGGA
jgi:methylated-DNA-[protein]-cysteine S-methyltransferase